MYHHNQVPSLSLHDYFLNPRVAFTYHPPRVNWRSAVHSVLQARFPASSTQPITSVFEKMAVANHPRRTCSPTTVSPDTAIGAPPVTSVTDFQHVHQSPNLGALPYQFEKDINPINILRTSLNRSSNFPL
jgi:hypothetical protein